MDFEIKYHINNKKALPCGTNKLEKKQYQKDDAHLINMTRTRM